MMLQLQSPKERDEAIQAYLDSFVTPTIIHPKNQETEEMHHNGNTDNKEEDYSPQNADVPQSKSIPLKRIHCCGSPRCIYCPECCQLLISKRYLPSPIRTNGLSLPFQLDILLDDRRGVATGLHAYILLHQGRANDHPVRLIDFEKEDSIPLYDNGHSNDHTFVLFPSKDSIPISNVAHCISRLIVLDCKWTKSKCIKHSQLTKLTKVHLTSPPSTSHFWRWHNAGPGRISTIEAIYCAAWEVLQCNHHEPSQKESKCTIQNQTQWHFDASKSSQPSSIHLLFLFGLQRAVIRQKALQEGRTLPYTENGKEKQRKLRQYAGTEKQRNDKEIGKLWKEKRRLEQQHIQNG